METFRNNWEATITGMCLNVVLNIISPMIEGDVLYYPCEITQELAFARALTNVTQKGMNYLYDNPEKFKEAAGEAIMTHAAGNLVMKGYPAGTATIQTIRNHARMAIQKYNLKKLKAIVIDYADTVLPSGTFEKEYLRQAGVYTEARALGAEFNCPVIMPDRCTKEATDQRVPNMRAFQGAFAKGGIVDVAIGLCVQSDQSVVTSIGQVKIGDLRAKLRKSSKPICALSHNFLTGQDEWKPITNWFHNGYAEEPFVRIKTDARSPGMYHQRSRGTVVTKEHLIYQPDGNKVRAGDLRVGDTVSALVYELSADQRQVLLGTLMGDGHIRDGMLVEDHGIQQKYYLEWKRRVFETLSTSMMKDTITSKKYGDVLLKERERVTLQVRGSSEIARLRSIFYVGSTKIVPPETILNELTEFGLSVWFMDDGSIEHTNDRIRLHTQGFTDAECDFLLSWFERRWGLIGKVRNRRIDFDAVSTRQILNLLSKYLTRNAHRVHGIRGESKTFLCPETKQGHVKNGEAFVTSISPAVYATKRRVKRSKIDIEVADNHNYYLASGTLVSNCMTDEEVSQNIFRTFVFINRHGPAFQHFRGKVDPETMFIDLGEEIPYDPEDEDDKSSSKKRIGKKKDQTDFAQIDE